MPSLVGTSVAANYLVAAPSTNFSTRQLSIINVAQAAIHTGFAAADSLFSKTVRALQQTAEVYAVGTPNAGNCQFIIATDTQWNGGTAAQQGGVAGNGSFDKLEAAVLAGSGVAATITLVAL